MVGAGFGGLACAKALGRDGTSRVTLIDRHNFHTFRPLLYQVATSGLNSADVAYPIRGILRRLPNVALRVGTVDRIDPVGRVAVVDGDEIAYDDLVVALGSRAAYFGVPGAAERTFALYTLADAVELRNHVLSRFEAASVDPSLVADGALNVVVVGGGPTGVETAGALVELYTKVLQRDFPKLGVDRARIVLVEQAATLLAPFMAKSQHHAAVTLQSRGVELLLGTAVAGIEATRVRLTDGSELPAHTVVWAAGIQASEITASLGCALGRGGRIVVDADMSVPGCEGLWAIGDAAQIAVPEADGGGTLPQLAQVAIQTGEHAAAQILRRRLGEPTEPFHYHDKGIMATIGRRAAVAELPHGVQLRGMPAWIAWLALHLVTLLGMRNRASVLVNWSWNYLTWDRGQRLILQAVPSRENEAGVET